ncbi:hypothetical protein D2M30_1248 [Bacillus amyloliquefaciens]|nr:hypothetical protein D2M30_1248 [Bacillus amyloliquefaciens]
MYEQRAEHVPVRQRKNSAHLFSYSFIHQASTGLNDPALILGLAKV